MGPESLFSTSNVKYIDVRRDQMILSISKPTSKKVHELPDAHMNIKHAYLKTKPELPYLPENVTTIFKYAYLFMIL